MSSPSYATKVAQSLKNLKERKLKGVDLKNVLLACKKDAWFKAANDNNRDAEGGETPKKNSKPGVFTKTHECKTLIG